VSERRDRRRHWRLLLLILLASFFVQGAIPEGSGQRVVASALLSCSVVLAMYAANARPLVVRSVTAVALGLFVVAIVRAASGGVGEGAYRLLLALVVSLAPPAVVLGVRRDLRASWQVRMEAATDVLSLYLLFGMVFAFVYGTLDHLGAAPFFAGGAAATVSRCLYFSFTTLTTVGYGDLPARTNLGHTLAVSEALLGQIYLVTIVAIIVGNLGRQRIAERQAQQAQPTGAQRAPVDVR